MEEKGGAQGVAKAPWPAARLQAANSVPLRVSCFWPLASGVCPSLPCSFRGVSRARQTDKTSVGHRRGCLFPAQSLRRRDAPGSGKDLCIALSVHPQAALGMILPQTCGESAVQKGSRAVPPSPPSRASSPSWGMRGHRPGRRKPPGFQGSHVAATEKTNHTHDPPVSPSSAAEEDVFNPHGWPPLARLRAPSCVLLPVGALDPLRPRAPVSLPLASGRERLFERPGLDKPRRWSSTSGCTCMTLGHCCEDGLGAKLGRHWTLALAVSCVAVMGSLEGRRGRRAVDACADANEWG